MLAGLNVLLVPLSLLRSHLTTTLSDPLFRDVLFAL